jgi:hypothetical protein
MNWLLGPFSTLLTLAILCTEILVRSSPVPVSRPFTCPIPGSAGRIAVTESLLGEVEMEGDETAATFLRIPNTRIIFMLATIAYGDLES